LTPQLSATVLFVTSLFFLITMFSQAEDKQNEI